MNQGKNFRRSTWISILVIVALIAVTIVVVPAIRQPVLRTVGWSLVVNEAIGPADIIVISLESDGAGVLEAADLVQSGIANRVAVFVDPPTGYDHEFIRRGVPYDNWGARQSRQLKLLGVTEVMQIPKADTGTGGIGEVLQAWCEQHQFQSIILVTAADHSRRMRRVLDREMKGHSAHVTVRPARYSSFDPDRWWQSRGGMRIAIIELQKLVLDVVLHPM